MEYSRKKAYFHISIAYFNLILYKFHATALVSKRLVLDFKLSDHYIHIENLETVLYDYNYTIASLDFSADSKILQSGSTTGNIDISDLPEGMYVLTVVDPVSGMSETFKFQK